MTTIKTKIFSALFVATVLTLLLFNAVTVSAQEQLVSPASCLGEDSINSSIQARQGIYSLNGYYTDNPDLKYNGTISYAGADGVCKNVVIQNGQGVIEFDFDGFLIIELSRPTNSESDKISLIISEDFPDSSNCIGSGFCIVNYQGNEYKLLPNRLSSVFDSAAVYLYQSIEDVAIEKVAYAVDGRVVYERPDIQEFNMNYVSSGEHTLQTIVTLSNGANLVSEKNIENGTITDIFLNSRSWLFSDIRFDLIGVN